MSVPLAYTALQARQFMVLRLGGIGDVLGWHDESAELNEALTDVLLDYGVDDLADATDVRKLRALLEYHAWRLAVDALAAHIDIDTGGKTYTRSQLQKQAAAGLAAAFHRAEAFMPEQTVEFGHLEIRGIGTSRDEYER